MEWMTLWRIRPSVTVGRRGRSRLVLGAAAVAFLLVLVAGRGALSESEGEALAVVPGPAKGCTAKGPSFRDSGPRSRRLVSLTFDGGPTRQYTPKVLSILDRFNVKATFFVRGSFAANHTRLLKRIYRKGHEIANHSYTHPMFPSGRELSRTNRVIRRLTGFRPCLFRAPYGAVDRALIERARNQGMLTIGWDVDSWDGFIEGLSAGTIFDRVTGMARPGSIVLMHDGIGSHAGTVKALPRILRRLKARHLRQVTVSRLLGLRQDFTSASPRTFGRAANPVFRGPAFLDGIRKMAIPFGAVRKNQMAAYSRRHYGRSDWRLEPKQIVLHYADAPTIGSVFNTFAENRPDPHFGELPNVCTHFVVGDGRPVQMASLRVRCRHVLGLNHVAIGIEHLGYSDRDLMGNRHRRRTSMRLVHRLMCLYDIPVRDVIGHSESLRSRYYRERIDRLEGMTSPDLSHSTMRKYRKALSKMRPCSD